jgi:hypothetical protein
MPTVSDFRTVWIGGVLHGCDSGCVDSIRQAKATAKSL